jgi:hypothetical protein
MPTVEQLFPLRPAMAIIKMRKVANMVSGD